MTSHATIKELAARRVEAVWACVNVLCPDLSMDERKALAEKFLDLARAGNQPTREIQITPPQVQEIVWRHAQCANRHCSMVLFPREVADELNEFFRQDS